MEPGLMRPDEFKQGWRGGLPETPCGFGSKKSETVAQRKMLPIWAETYKTKSIVDIGAGDLNWIKLVKWPAGVTYTPYDLVPRHPDVQPFDILRQVPPKADLVLCLWLLNHLPVEDAQQAVKNIKASKSKWLAYTYWPAMDDSLSYTPADSFVVRERIGAEIRLVKCSRL